MNFQLKPAKCFVRRKLLLILVFVFANATTIPAQTLATGFAANDSGIVSTIQGLEMSAETRLAACEMVGDVQSRALDGGMLEYGRLLRHKDGHECHLVERFTLTNAGIRWDIEILGKGAPWSTAINTQLTWKNADALTWWTTWGDPRPDAPPGDRSGAPQASAWWQDPLVSMPFKKARFRYGGNDQFDPRAFSIPIISVMNAQNDTGISVVASPEDLLFQLDLHVEQTGEMTLSRTKHRITEGHSIAFSLDLITHEADWRGGLAWMTGRYPAYFDPPNPRVQEMAGCGGYSSKTDALDVERLNRMAFKVNWKASFDFPYMGMFIPPVPDATTEWTTFEKKTQTIEQMREEMCHFTDPGFYVLNYFNVTEFGNDIQYPAPARKAVKDEDLWKNPNDFLYALLNDAILLDDNNGKPHFSWEGCIAMDPGDPVYQEFLVEQAQRHVDLLPEGAGICIDRMDWLQKYNARFDDGRCWVNDKPARSLVIGWNEIMPRIATIMHDNDRVIYGNPHYRRLDLVRYMDGIYDEFGQVGLSMNLCSFLALRKPVMAWTIVTPELRQAPDAYFQRHLHMGAFLTAPLPGNDHTIRPSDGMEQHYFDYGPLLEALRGKQWLFKPHVVKVAGNTAKANIFQVPEGYVIPVTFGGNATLAQVIIRHLNAVDGQATVIHPGEKDWAPLPLEVEGDEIVLNVPLSRGCAMVRLQ